MGGPSLNNPNRTLAACCIGFITQAVTVNFLPLLYLTFNREFGISLGLLALISTIFFFTQLLLDIVSAWIVRLLGYRATAIVCEACAAAGLCGLAFLPDVMSDPYAAIIICVMFYAVASGLLEVICSPMVNACPFENKEAVMSRLHSFYSWGCVAVIALSSLFFAVFGVGQWRMLCLMWALLPILNIPLFATCPVFNSCDEVSMAGTSKVLCNSNFLFAAVLMITAGASEFSIGQWASAYAESALGLSKTLGDLVGPCLFAASMGLSRSFHARTSKPGGLIKSMCMCSAVCLAGYGLTALSPVPVVGLAGCVMCGLSLGIIWPGAISFASMRMPSAGPVLFSLLALAGDIGGSVGPAVVGFTAQRFCDNVRAGFAAGCLFPLVLMVALVVLWIGQERKEK